MKYVKSLFLCCIRVSLCLYVSFARAGACVCVCVCVRVRVRVRVRVCDLAYLCYKRKYMGVYHLEYSWRGLQLFIKMLCFTETYFIAKSCASVL